MRDVVVDVHLGVTITVVVVDGHDGPVDGDLLKVGASVAAQLRVEVREDTALQQRIFAKVEAANNVAGLELGNMSAIGASATGAKRAVSYHDLLRLSKVVARVPVQPHLANLLQRDELLGDDLGGVQDVNAEVEGLVLIDDLHVQLPFGVVALLDGLPEVLAVEVGVRAGGDLGLFPDEAGLAKRGLPVELDELRLALVVDKAVGVDAEAVLRAC